MDANISARQGEGIDAPVLNNKKSVVLLAVIGLSRNPVADLVDVFVDQGVLNDLTAVANTAHDRPAQPRFVIRGQDRVGRAAHIRQPDVIRTGATDKNQ